MFLVLPSWRRSWELRQSQWLIWLWLWPWIRIWTRCRCSYLHMREVEKWCFMAANTVTTSGGVRHEGRCANCEVGLPPIQYGYVTESYNFSLPTTLLFWTMSGKSPSDRGHGDISPAVAIPSVATATSLSSWMVSLIAQYIWLMIPSLFISWPDFQWALN